MSSLAVASIVFLCCCGSAGLGMFLHVRVPDHHLDADSKDVVKLVLGLIATLAALVLGLLIASAKTSYDTQTSDVQQLAASVMQLDQSLADYGPEAKETRDLLRQAVTFAHARIWSPKGMLQQNLDPAVIAEQAGAVYRQLRSLTPKTDAQRAALSTASQLGSQINRTRILMFEQTGGQIAWPFLGVLVFWVSMLFAGFGLFARFNATVMVALIVGALSLSGALFLILELNQPYQGFLQISDAPLLGALQRIDR